MVWYSHLFQNFPQFIVIHRVKGFGIVNKAEIDVFLELSCFFDDPADVGNLISGSSAYPKTSLDIWKSTVIKSDLNLSLGSTKWGEKTNGYWIHLGSFIHRARPVKKIQHGIFDHWLRLYWLFILTSCAWHIQLKCLTWSAVAGGRYQMFELRTETFSFILLI